MTHLRKNLKTVSVNLGSDIQGCCPSLGLVQFILTHNTINTAETYHI